MERRRLIINFKNTPEEIALYEAVKNHSSISGYVKDLLKGLIKEAPTQAKGGRKSAPEELDPQINEILGDL